MKNKNQKGVISIIAVLSIGIFALGTSLMVAKGVLQQLVVNRNNVSTYQAFYTAESGANEGVYRFINDESYRDQTDTLSGTDSPNDLTANISAGHFVNGYATIIGDSSSNDNFRKITTTVRNYPDDPAFVFNYGLYTPMVINMNGSASISGDIFAYEEFYCKGKEDNAKCEDNINGDIIEYEDYEFPEFEEKLYPTEKNFCDAIDYLEGKHVEDFVHIGSAECKKGGKPVNRVINNIDLKGALKVDGDLKLTGGLIEATDDYLALIVNGNLELTGGITIKGVIYVTGETEIGTGGAEIDGSLISLQQIKITGNLEIDYDESILDIWQDLINQEDGPDLYNDFVPEIDRWDEK